MKEERVTRIEAIPTKQLCGKLVVHDTKGSAGRVNWCVEPMQELVRMLCIVLGVKSEAYLNKRKHF